MNAYNYSYTTDSFDCLGEAFDFVAKNNIDPDVFNKLLSIVKPGIEFSKGNPKYIAGMSGVEFALETLREAGIPLTSYKTEEDFERSVDYWCGYILSYAQWKLGISFKKLRKVMPYNNVKRLYDTYHEASEDKLVDLVKEKINEMTENTLKQARKNIGLSQSQLAEEAGINIRTLQQYEGRYKDIKMAAAVSVEKLANTLGCETSDLITDSI